MHNKIAHHDAVSKQNIIHNQNIIIEDYKKYKVPKYRNIESLADLQRQTAFESENNDELLLLPRSRGTTIIA